MWPAVTNSVLLLFASVYFPLTVFIGLFWMQAGDPISLLLFAAWQLIIAKIVYDLIWMLSALRPPKNRIPKLSILQTYPKVALLYVCRDDVVEDCLRSLSLQNYPNGDVFILDDSQNPANRAIVNQLTDEMILEYPGMRVEIIRRTDLRGYKAGNINHWLKHYGGQYKYFIVFDNDSKAGPGFIQEMVQYAEHPLNENIAIFQGKIIPWNTANCLARFVGATAPINMLLLENVGNPCGTIISFGHNNLHRTAPIWSLDGFNEEFTSEDTAITFELDSIGFKTALVDVVSFEAIPDDVQKIRRRAIRWAGQTAALFRSPWRITSAAYKIELSRQLIYYFINAIFFIWLIGSVWYIEASDNIYNLVHQVVALFQFYDSGYVISFSLVIGLFFLHFAAHLLLAYRCRIRWVDYCGHLLVSLALYFYTIIPVSLALLTAFLGKPVAFRPSGESGGAPTFQKTMLQMLLPWAIVTVALIHFIGSGKNPFAYLSGWWALLIWITPFLLYGFQKYPFWKDPGRLSE